MAIDRKARLSVEVVGEGEQDLFERQAKALEEMESAGDRAGATMEKAGEKIARSAGSGERAVSDAKAALDAYVVSLQAAEGAGVVIGEAELAKLHELEGAYQDAVAEVGEFRAAQQQAKRDIEQATEAAGGQAARINSLGDIVRQVANDLGPAATKWVSWGAAAAGAFTVGYQAGLKFKGLLDEISGGKYSEGIQRDLTNWLRLDTGINTVAEDAELLRNQLNILRNEGIDPTGMSAAEVAAKVEELGKKTQQAGMDSSAAVTRFKEFAAAMKQMVTDLKASIEALPSLSGKDQADQIRLMPAAIKEVLDAYESLGLKVPAELQKIADSWGVLSSKSKEHADRQSELVRQILTDMSGQVVRFQGEWEAQAKALAEALPSAFASMPPINMMPPGQLENTKQVLAQMMNVFRMAGDEIPAHLQKMAASVGVFNTALAGINGQAVLDLSAKLGAAMRSLQADAMAAAGSVQKVFRDPLAAGDITTELLDPGDGFWVNE